MGVQGLWPLLEPVGRRVNIEALTNKKLAVDASIWVHQFIKTMRAADGEVLKNAHLLGFFRRICKLLFNHIHPVFVFDGGTPALKKRTTIARRRQREKQGAKLRKAAEKLLLAHLKKHALDNISNGQEPRAGAAAAAAEQLTAASAAVEQAGREAGLESGDEMALVEELTDGDLPDDVKAMLAGLQPGSSRFPEEAGEGKDDESAEAQLQMQQAIAASLAKEDPDPEPQGREQDRPARGGRALAKPPERLSKPAQVVALTSRAAEAATEEDEEEEEVDEEGILLAGGDLETLDPAVLSTLPPSMQLDIMTKLREQRTYGNREGFQRRQAQPQSFSQFQMAQYLKASAVRKQMDGIRDAMNAAVLDSGAAAKRIAGDAGREYVLHKDPEASNTNLKGRAGSGSTPGKADIKPAKVDPNSGPSPGGGHAILPSAPEEPAASGAGMEISLDLEELGGAVADEPDEWEDVEPSPKASQQAADDKGVDVTKRPADWRERMAQRQKYWSVSTGFKFGRKLADWGKDGGETSTLEPAADSGRAVEDAELQQAIELSLRESRADPGPSSRHKEDEMEWEAVGLEGVDHEDDDLQAALRLSLDKAGEPQGAADSPLLLEPAAAASQSEALPEAFARPTPEAPLKLPAALQTKPAAKFEGGSKPVGKAQKTPKAALKLPPAPKRPTALRKLAAAAPKPAVAARGPATAADSVGSRGFGSPGGGIRAPGSQAVPDSAAEKDSEADQPAVTKAASPVDALEGTLNPAAGLGAAQPPAADRPQTQQLEGIREPAADASQPDSRFKAAPEPGLPATYSKEPLFEAPGCNAPPEEHGRATAGGAQEPQLGSDAQPGPSRDVAATSEASAHKYGPTSMGGSQPDMQAKEAVAGPSVAVSARPEPPALEQGGLQPIPDSSILHPDAGAIRDSRRRASPQPWPSQQQEQEAGMFQDFHEEGPNGSQEKPIGLEAEDIAEQIAEHEKETKRLAKEHRKQAGISDTPTGDMYGECQELLQMFGLPYIIAPVEAEAQCAWLDSEGLVDGVITDDNDVFLFGGEHVYRHIFADKQYVEEYRAQDFQAEMGLSREKLIHLALLLGSDYTEGISGIGIVNAVEVVHAFAGVEGLKQFKEWVMTPDKDVLEAAQKVGRQPKKAAADEEGEAAAEGGEPPEVRRFKREHMGARRNWDIPMDFPDWRVVSAYTKAKVDTSKEAISFSRPDMEHLCRFCTEKFGWPTSKTAELLEPVLKAFDQQQTQSTLDNFLTFRQRFAKIKSKRLQKAVSAISGGHNSDILLAEEDPIADPPQKKRRKKAAAKSPPVATGVLEEADDLQLSQEDLATLDSLAGSQDPSPDIAKSKAKPSRKAGGGGGRGRGRARGVSKRGRGKGRGKTAATRSEGSEGEQGANLENAAEEAVNPAAGSSEGAAGGEPRRPSRARRSATAEASKAEDSASAASSGGGDDDEWEAIDADL